MDPTRNLAVTVLGAAIVAVVAGVVWFGLGDTSPAPAEPVESSGTDALTAVSEVTVHVSGAVVAPGLVRVPADARVAGAIRAAGGVRVDARLSELNLAAPVRDGDHIVVPRAGEGTGASEEPSGIDLNRSTALQLEALPGVGPVLAERIVAHREEYGPFGEIEDLLDVPGIGEAKLAQMRPAIDRP